jgi:muramidase (phage lysozyme)
MRLQDGISRFRTGRAFALVLFFAILAPQSFACTEAEMLDLIGSLEAPKGYDQVYGGVKLDPPRPITSMRISEVLAWQRQASRTAVSSAAGRYQVIRATLTRMVDRGVVGMNERYSPGVQDRIGRYLLRETGYRSGPISSGTANRIAGVWAALPTTGPGASGASFYEGIAGNHALLDAETFRAFYSCEIPLAQATASATAARVGTAIGLEIDKLLRILGETSAAVMEAVRPIVLSLLGAILTFGIINKFGNAAIKGGAIGAVLAGFLPQILIAILIVGSLATMGPLIWWLAENALGISGATGPGQGAGFSLTTYAREKLSIAQSIMLEGSNRSLSVWTAVLGGLEETMRQAVFGAFLALCSLTVVIMTAISLGVVLFYWGRVLLVGAIAIILLPFGVADETRDIMRRTLTKMGGYLLAIVAVSLILAATLEFQSVARGALNPVLNALVAVLFEITATILIFVMPARVARILV